MAIFKSAMQYYEPRPSSDWNDADGKAWREGINLLLSGALVAKDWYMAARRILYAGRINLHKSESVRLLLRTAREDLGTPCPIQHLLFANHQSFTKEAEFQALATDLIICCTELQHLEGSFSFAKSTPFPVFESLRELSVTDQLLHELAPLLQYLPNLESLNILCIIDPEQPRAVKTGTPLHDNLGAALKDIPPPRFSLKKLHLSQCEIPLSQWRWLLSSCTSIQHAQLQELKRGAVHLADVIGPAVRSLRLEGAMDHPQKGDQELANTLPAYINLTSLQINGGDWPWAQLLSDIKASLESFTISYSSAGVDNVTRVLSDSDWQPSLRCVEVYHWANVDYFYGVKASDVKDARAKMEHACARRSVKLCWITEGRADIAEYYGVTENDLIIP
ncbi:hypothetical protein BOTBODRAFT_186728 [Botryobasidium botryosum FD-172 SS1]|uniref:F-box domain-containing protein n=1 Tax=Botryobasidium botryosum (strain FD-172 SS1) TaxID=930990 RepID=A0A067MWT1_BOTB1|nr:hypothetical protein BOTBODRAFT_186728 [Botryobasidium botryosum FD-172 SS1]